MMMEQRVNSLRWSNDLAYPPLRRRSDVACEELDGEAVLHDPASGTTHHLNATALAVWNACESVATTSNIARELSDAYAVDAELVEADLEELVVLMAEAGLLVEARQ